MDSNIFNVHQLGIQNIQHILAQCFYRRLQVTKFISICHELCLYAVAINLCTSTSIARCFIEQWYEVNICEYCASE